ncbi:hypothetical protein L1D14_07275 [Vibrio tubiashii]|uniref:DNA translocase FtsK n=1 Tax=Vibrio tubiashii TaxID=29498 RepID=UPI001EFCC0DB|nr:DNA translocase FtsK [Vibrio tubiashii]MCG9576038.1 hypothetical protein [Vibrio tubiashii]
MTYSMIETDLQRLKEHPEFQGKEFGVSRIQRHLGIGYNRASALVEEAKKRQVLTIGIESQHLLKLTE